MKVRNLMFNENDPWNYQVFSVGGNGRYTGEESFNNVEIGGNISANRTTEDWMVRLSASGKYDERNFEVESGTFTSTTRRGSIFGQIVKTVTGKWSAGGFVYASTSTQNNIDFAERG